MIFYCVWPDYTVCFQGELSQMTHMSDDYLLILADSESDAIEIYKHREANPSTVVYQQVDWTL